MARIMFASLAQPQHSDDKTMWQHGIRIKYLISLRLFVWQIPKLHITIYHLKTVSFVGWKWFESKPLCERSDAKQNKMKNWSPNNRMQTSIRRRIWRNRGAISMPIAWHWHQLPHPTQSKHMHSTIIRSTINLSSIHNNMYQPNIDHSMFMRVQNVNAFISDCIIHTTCFSFSHLSLSILTIVLTAEPWKFKHFHMQLEIPL